jgi:hypothetical protein
VDWYPGCAGAAGQHLLPGRALPHPQGGKEVYPSSSLLLEGEITFFSVKKIYKKRLTSLKNYILSFIISDLAGSKAVNKIAC